MLKMNRCVGAHVTRICPLTDYVFEGTDLRRNPIVNDPEIHSPNILRVVLNL